MQKARYECIMRFGKDQNGDKLYYIWDHLKNTMAVDNNNIVLEVWLSQFSSNGYKEVNELRTKCGELNADWSEITIYDNQVKEYVS